MDIKELRQKSKDELRAVLKEKQQRIDEIQTLLHQKKIKNVHERAEVKKDIARIFTVLQSQ